MSSDPSRKSRKPAPGARDDRLKSALKANLARRKAQARGRAARGTDGKSDASPDTNDKNED